ncbi:MAG TPA: TMEM175 family protein [Chitinophagaceae bacterium]|nr:TMEM175 family protein [Chitinophagaceae bacterium]
MQPKREVITLTKRENFKERGYEMLRIEALSDAVFAFSVSLLVVALEVPQNFNELRTILKGAIPFFATVALLFLFWYQQYKFFRRYGLNDIQTILYNLVYLAVILFYVYPMKFLFSLLLGSWTGINLFPEATEKGISVINREDFPQLIILFSAGYAIIWLLLALMYSKALKEKQKLDLSLYEIYFTQKEKRGAMWNVVVGAVAILMALLSWERMAGLCYLFIPVLLYLNEILFKKSLKKYKV